MIKLEICCADINSVTSAIRGGADRIELCTALEVGGLTPSIGLVRNAIDIRDKEKVNAKDVKIHVLIRPRAGDFVYDKAEVEVMLDDIIAVKESGADGVVIGALLPNGEIDTDTTRILVEASKGMNITFHRAFDRGRDAEKSLLQISRLGCSRILTSGCAPTAEDGIETLRRLVELAPPHLTILAGCGITPKNVAKILELTGVKEIHASAKTETKSQMLYHRPHITMGTKDTAEDSISSTSEAIVRQLSTIISLK